MGFRTRWRVIPTGERVEIVAAALCVALAYVALATGAHGWQRWLPQVAAVLLCLRLAWRHWRH